MVQNKTKDLVAFYSRSGKELRYVKWGSVKIKNP